MKYCLEAMPDSHLPWRRGIDPETGQPRVLRGTYQSPILVQWQPAEKQERHIDVVVTKFS